MARVKIGDVIEIRTKLGLAYAQYTHKTETMGAVMRLLEGIHPSRPQNFATVLTRPIQFTFLFPLAPQFIAKYSK